jgi:L-amino acid N-acyltransferase YncA
MNNQHLSIRACAETDWPAVSQIIRAVSEKGDTFTYPADMSDSLARRLWIQDPPGLTVVAVEASGTIVGTAKMGCNQLGPGSHVATASFMVAASARRCGVGRSLAEFALTWARQQGYRAMQFNAVVASNLAAISLWQELGFSIVGTVPAAFLHPDASYVDLHVMHRFLW